MAPRLRCASYGLKALHDILHHAAAVIGPWLSPAVAQARAFKPLAPDCGMAELPTAVPPQDHAMPPDNAAAAARPPTVPVQGQGRPPAWLPVIPDAFFGMVLGVTGLGQGWRLAHRLWDLPAAIGETVLAAGFLLWLVLALLYAAKWLWLRPQALAETRHPVACCFLVLAGVATMLQAGVVLPYSRILAWLLLLVGGGLTLGLGLWVTGRLWQGGREDADTTAALYLPLVGGSFVLAGGLALLGQREAAQLAFGAGLFSWLAVESVLLRRLYVAAPLPPPLRPTLGIQMAPPVVGGMAYLALQPGAPDLLMHMLLGYGLLQAMLLLRLLPWIRQQPFIPAYWGFSFGVTALGNMPMALQLRGESGPVAALAPLLFAASNLIIGGLALGSLRLGWRALRH